MFDLSTISLGLAALLFAAHPSHDQTFTPQSIQFIGATNYSDVELADAGGLEVGQTYTADDLTHHAQQLLDIGIFDKVSYKFDGGKLTYTVKMSPQAFPIELSNLPLEVGEVLEARLHAKIPLYHGTVPAQGLLVEAVRQTLENLLAGEGVHAEVATELVVDPATRNTTAVRFAIASPPVKVGILKMEGVSDFLKPQLEKSATLTDVAFDTEQSAAQIEQTIKDYYAAHGFAAAEVHAVRYGFPSTSDGVIRVPYKVSVKEGRAYRLGTVTLDHNLPLDPVEVDRLMASRSSFMPESMFLESLLSQLQVDLKGQGYLNCRVVLQTHLDDKVGVANYTIVADLGRADSNTSQANSNRVQGSLKNLIRP
jgi:outer membrane protein assembly factor BamA